MRTALAVAATLALSCGLFAQEKGSEKPAEKSATRTVKIKVNYSGSGTVDDKHNIVVFLFDSPDFMKGEAMPIATQSTPMKDGVVTFADLGASTVYATAVYDPSGQYDGMSAPPSGASLGMYSKTPGTPEPIKVEAGKTAEVELAFDDAAKMP